MTKAQIEAALTHLTVIACWCAANLEESEGNIRNRKVEEENFHAFREIADWAKQTLHEQIKPQNERERSATTRAAKFLSDKHCPDRYRSWRDEFVAPFDAVRVRSELQDDIDAGVWQDAPMTARLEKAFAILKKRADEKS